MRTLKIAALIALFITSFTFCMPVSAQQLRDEIEVLRGQISADRQAVVAINMRLSEKQGEKFWPLYREYHLEKDVLMDRRVKILTEFSENYMGMTFDQAENILIDALKLEKSLLKLKTSYRKKFQKVLSSRGALRYYQIENKLDTIINFNIASVVPLR